MDLINEQYVSSLKGSEKTGKVARLVKDGTGGYLHVNPHLISYNMSQCCLTETRRAMEKHMVKSLSPHFGRFYINVEIGHNLFLACEIFKFSRADNSVQILIFVSVCVARIEFCHQRVNYQIQIY